MARAQVTKAGAVLAATALAWLAASHFSHESATLERLELLLGARDSGGSPAATEADAPSSTPVAAAPGAATDDLPACDSPREGTPLVVMATTMGHTKNEFKRQVQRNVLRLSLIHI